MADDWGMGGSSVFGDADLFAGHLIGENYAQAGTIGGLKGELDAAERSRNRLSRWISDIANTAGFFSADDAGLRAVIRTQSSSLRSADAFNQLLVKENRALIYGMAHDKFNDEFIKSGSNVANGWEQQLANRFALYTLISKMDEALAISNPKSEMLLEEGKYKVYAEGFNAKMDRYDIREFNGAGVNRKGLDAEDGLSGIGLRKKAEREAAGQIKK